MLNPMEEMLRNRVTTYAEDPATAQTGFGSAQERKELATAYEERPGVDPATPEEVSAPVTGAANQSLSNQQMGGAFSGAAGVAQAGGAGGTTTGALSGAGAGFAVGGHFDAAIGAGVGLAAGIFGDKAKREAEKRQRVIESLKMEAEGIQRSQEQLRLGTQEGIAQILGGTARALR